MSSNLCFGSRIRKIGTPLFIPTQILYLSLTNVIQNWFSRRFTFHGHVFLMIPYGNFRIFGQLIRNASMGTIQLVTSPTGVIMFVPLDSAFDGLDVESWNQSVIDMVKF